MKLFVTVTAIAVVMSPFVAARGDFAGPATAMFAASPDGNLIVRLTVAENSDAADRPPRTLIHYYRFNPSKNDYVPDKVVECSGAWGQMLYVSNAGDVVAVGLSETGSLQIFSPDGKLVKKVDLKQFLTQNEIDACARTGSTLQWLDEGSFAGRKFYFSGPSHLIRAIRGSFSVMRGADEKVRFAASIDAATGELTKDAADEN